MRERIEYDIPPALGDLRPIAEWLRQHHVEPGRVCLPGWIERDEETCSIRYLRYHLNERGSAHLVPGTGGWMDRPDYRAPIVATEVHTVHLGSPPAPFPSEWRAPWVRSV